MDKECPRGPYIVAIVHAETYDLDLYFEWLWGKRFPECFNLKRAPIKQ